jgi:DNA-directed RNA polymerase specialized sigma24 family protein
VKEHSFVQNRASKSDDTTAPHPGSAAVDEGAVSESASGHDPGGSPDQDQQIIDRCLAGEVAAWEELYTQCHGPLVALIKGMLYSADTNLVDEIAARVWYALVAKDGALLARFDPSRGARLITFMRAIARDEAKRYFRSEVRRKERETIATREKPASIPHGPASHLLVEEFLTTLSPEDRTFCLQHVLATPGQDAAALPSRPAGWQHTHRLYRKILAFLGREI